MYERYSLKELKELARMAKIPDYYRLNRQPLVDALEAVTRNTGVVYTLPEKNIVIQYDEYGVKELKEMAKTAEIERYYKLNKQDLVDALIAKSQQTGIDYTTTLTRGGVAAPVAPVAPVAPPAVEPPVVVVAPPVQPRPVQPVIIQGATTVVNTVVTGKKSLVDLKDLEFPAIRLRKKAKEPPRPAPPAVMVPPDKLPTPTPVIPEEPPVVPPAIIRKDKGKGRLVVPQEPEPLRPPIAGPSGFAAEAPPYVPPPTPAAPAPAPVVVVPEIPPVSLPPPVPAPVREVVQLPREVMEARQKVLTAVVPSRRYTREEFNKLIFKR